MAEPALKRMTVAEFLAWDDGSQRHFELIDGRIVAMAPPLFRHGAIAARVCSSLVRRLPASCSVAMQAGIVLPRRDDLWYEADLAVSCFPQESERFTKEPRIIVEVLSPSTQDHDLLQKLPDYRLLPSLDDLLYVSAEERLVRHWVRGQESRLPARVREGSLKLQAFEIELPLDEIYEGSGL
jgi:Uma2 family endonuclease